MIDLLLGPMLRYVGEDAATVWVETSEACEVEVLGHVAQTFRVGTHHYALVICEGLQRRATIPYEVHLGHRSPSGEWSRERRWPEEGTKFPPSVIRTVDPDARLRIAFGSCHVAVPHEAPFNLRKDEDERGREIDALYALAMEMVETPGMDDWPQLLLLLGDQVYADQVSPGVNAFIRLRPAHERNGAPETEAADFEEYVRLYWDSWRDATLRWLLSTVPSAMIFDDHDVHDDWNTSQAWVDEIRRQPWWHERIVAAYQSYWVYQHLGNLAPSELEHDPLWCEVREADDGEPALRAMAEKAERETEGSRFSFCRDLGRTRIVMLDSRAGRVLDSERRMVDHAEWAWIEEHATGDVDHLLLGTSLPYLLAPGMHYLEAWNEALCAGAWGSWVAKASEKLRQGLDLEHWGAFEESFRELTALLEAVGSGRRGRAPESIVVLSGDVHHAYLAETAFRRDRGVTSHVYQAVCSPFRNPLDGRERRVIRAAASKPAHALARLFARAAGVQDPDIRWRFADDPVFDNQVAFLEIDGPSATMRIAKTKPGDLPHPRLHETVQHVLA